MRVAALGGWLPVTAISGLALAMRLWGIDAQSLWTDELFSVTHIHQGFERILLAGFRTEPNPPLYFVLLRLWCGVFGDGEVAARTLSVLISTATVPVIYATGAITAGRRAGAIAALLFAMAILQIEYAQEARQYALLVLALSVASLGLAMAVSHPAAASHRPAGAIFAAGVIVATYSHNIGVIYWFAMDLCLLLHVAVAASRREARLPARVAATWAGCNALAIVVCAPQLYAIMLFRGADGWIPPASAATLLAMAKATLFTYLAPDDAIGLLGLGVAGAGVVWAAVANRKQPSILILDLLLPALAFATIVAISLFRPVMLARTILFVPVPLYLLMGSALARIARAEVRLAGIGAALAVEVAAMLVYWPSFTREQWREIVPLIARQSGPDDALMLLSPEAQWAFQHYWPAGSAPARFAPMRAPRRSWEIETAPPDDDWLPEGLAAVQNAVRRGGAVWLVARWDMAPALRRLDAVLSPSLVVQPRLWDRADYVVLVSRVAPASGPIRQN